VVHEAGMIGSLRSTRLNQELQVADAIYYLNCQQAANFLNLMAKEIDLRAPCVPEFKTKLYGPRGGAFANGGAYVEQGKPPKPEFDPMRRKLVIDTHTHTHIGTHQNTDIEVDGYFRGDPRYIGP
jgi:hypothetical protein